LACWPFRKLKLLRRNVLFSVSQRLSSASSLKSCKCLCRQQPCTSRFKPWVQVLKDIEAALEPVIFPGQEDGRDPRACPACSTGRLHLCNSVHGGFVACSNASKDGSCTFRRGLLPRDDLSVEEQTTRGRLVGTDPQTHAEIRLLLGPYGQCDPHYKILLPPAHHVWGPAASNYRRGVALPTYWWPLVAINQLEV
jgi:hypothetical protein